MYRFERGQSTTVAPASRASRRSSAPAWTMCTSSGGVSVWNAPSDARYATGDFRGTRVDGSTPIPARNAGQRPVPSRSSATSSSSSATWTDVARPAAAAAAKMRANSSGPTENGACGAGT